MVRGIGYPFLSITFTNGFPFSVGSFDLGGTSLMGFSTHLSRSHGGVSTPSSLLGAETLAQLGGRDPDWVQRFGSRPGPGSDLPCARRPGRLRHPGRRYG